MWAEQEIQRAFLMFEFERYDDAVHICKDVHANAVKDGNLSDISMTKDQLFEAALEILLAGGEGTAKKIFYIANSPNKSDARPVEDEIFHGPAHSSRSLLDKAFNVTVPHFRSLQAMVGMRDYQHLKCAPYFVGKTLDQGLYGVEINKQNAELFFRMATLRGYEPGKLIPKRQQMEYKLIREAQQSDQSVFSNVPHDIVNKIARMRFESTLARSKLG